MKLGTMLRQFSDQIGFAFQNQRLEYLIATWSKCYSFDEVQNLIFGIMNKMAGQFGLKASLHDIPNVFSRGFNYEIAQFYPLYSICSLGYTNVLTSTLVRKNTSPLISLISHLTWSSSVCSVIIFTPKKPIHSCISKNLNLAMIVTTPLHI